MKNTVSSASAFTMTPSWQLVNNSFKLFKTNIEPVIYIILLPALLSVLGSLLTGGHYLKSNVNYSDARQKIGLLVTLLGVVWTIVNLGPSTLLQLKATDKKAMRVSKLYRDGLPFTLRIFEFYVLYVLMIIVGLILLIVPGFIVLRRYLLTPYYIVDKKMTIGAAMKQSASDSKPVKGYVWGVIGVQIVFVFVASLVQIIPLIGIVISQLITYMVIFTLVLRYREVQASAQ